MYATEVAQDRDARHVLAMECQDTGRLLAESSCTFRRRDVFMEIFMLAIVGRSDLCQESCDHLDDVCDRHSADLILLPYLLLASQGMPRAMMRSREDFFASKALDMIQVTDLDPVRGGAARTGE